MLSFSPAEEGRGVPGCPKSESTGNLASNGRRRHDYYKYLLRAGYTCTLVLLFSAAH